MKTYILRLDDASSKMDTIKWNKLEQLLDKYNIKPIVGIIADNKDPDFQKYEINKNFIKLVKCWQDKNWLIAMHGCNHKFETNNGGINPVNNYSEFAGVSLLDQRKKIRNAYLYFKKNKVVPKIFFAPAHTFDTNTLKAIKLETDINIISDTIANDIYYENDFYFIPQQSGKVRNLPFKTITFCYHPNDMKEADYEGLEKFIEKNQKYFHDISLIKRKRSLYDKILNKSYFVMRKLKKFLK